MYLDTNIIYNYIFETELTTYATEALSAPEPKIISDTAISEAIFVTLRKLAKDNQIEQGVRAQAIRAMHRNTAVFAYRK